MRKVLFRFFIRARKRARALVFTSYTTLLNDYFYRLLGESQVASDSETTTEKSEVDVDIENVLQSSMPETSKLTTLDVSSILKKEAADEPELVTDIPSPEALLKLDQPPEAMAVSLGEVDLKTTPEVPPPDEPLETGGETKAETMPLPLGEVDLNATPEVPPLDLPLQTGGETKPEAMALSLGEVDLNTTPEVPPPDEPLQTGGKTKAETMPLPLGEVDLKTTPEVLLLHEPIQTELVQELLKIGIYGEQTNLDGILEAAQKSRDATIERVKKLNILFGSEQNEGKCEPETLF